MSFSLTRHLQIMITMLYLLYLFGKLKWVHFVSFSVTGTIFNKLFLIQVHSSYSLESIVSVTLTVLISFLWIVIMSLILANVLCDLTPDHFPLLMPWFKLYELLVALSITKLYLFIPLIIFLLLFTYCEIILLCSSNFLRILFISFEFVNYTWTDLRFEIHLRQFFFHEFFYVFVAMNNA